MKELRAKVLQFLADSIIETLKREKNEIIFDKLIIIGIYLDDYAINKGIYLN